MTGLGSVTWPPAPINTDRLVLRAPEARDRAAFIELHTSPEVGAYIGGARPRDEVERAVRSVANGDFLMGPQLAQRAAVYLSGSRTRGPVPFPELTDREREVLDLVARGYDNATIARRMVLSSKTVRNYVYGVLAKLDVPDRAQLIVRARERGLGDP